MDVVVVVIVDFNFDCVWLVDVVGHAYTSPQASTKHKSSTTFGSAAVRWWLVALCHLQCNARPLQW